MAESKVRVGPDPKWEKLAMLRETTRRTGMIHELQALQLKMWPLVFTNATEAVCEFGYETKQVIYNLKKIKGKKPAKFNDRLKHLTMATQKLLGGEYGVVIKLDGKKVFYGQPTSDE